MKKTIVTTAAALALMASPMISGKADAASNQTNTNCNKAVKVVSHQYKFNSIQELENWMKKHHIKWTYKTAAPSSANTAANKAPENKTTENKTTENKTTENKTTANQATNKTTTANTANTSSSKASSTLNAYEKEVVNLVNQERAKNGLSALQADTALSKMARVKSNDMLAKKYFDHTSPTYGTPFDMMKKFGITYHYAGENIAMGQQTPQAVMKAWMNSEGHRANILNKNFTHIGVGYVENGHYWTQEFIGK
ncbi:CAP domain-containing protein [Heyndrickxia acidiproducens]|uniref:CAP domain-containing protein n=1 Tax=Heyndrickxia acidiproducens TaxID=1121084 RepID=UPI00037EFCAD|nr:CAP domain-containing protein [Heyndrickxia acidiproducens]